MNDNHNDSKVLIPRAKLFPAKLAKYQKGEKNSLEIFASTFPHILEKYVSNFILQDGA
jgi:hypothetical protein